MSESVSVFVSSFRPSTREVTRWAESLEALLTNQCKEQHLASAGGGRLSERSPFLSSHWPDGVAVFRHFLRSEFSEENLDFWLAVDRFKRTRPLGRRAARAAKIYDEFISTTAARQVGACLSASAGLRPLH